MYVRLPQHAPRCSYRRRISLLHLLSNQDTASQPHLIGLMSRHIIWATTAPNEDDGLALHKPIFDRSDPVALPFTGNFNHNHTYHSTNR